MKLHACAAGAALSAFAATAAAQSDLLVGITRHGAVLHRHDHFACRPAGNCAPLAFPNAAALPPFAGGTAWDATTSGAWITNGAVLAKVTDDCRYQCQPFAIPFPGPVATVATGLEVVESQDRLFVIDSDGVLHQWSLACPPVHLAQCRTGLVQVQQQVTTGLAVDEGLGLVFVAYPDFATGQNVIAVTQLGAACHVIQRVIVQPCPGFLLRPITGLAVDWGRRVLFATDGANTVAIRYAPAAIGIGVTGIDCCTPVVMPPVDPMIGLALRPLTERPHGDPCANGACPRCPMLHSTRNDSTLGNAHFTLQLAGAPAGSLAWDFVGFGPCTSPGVQILPLCGPFYLPVVLGSLGPNATGGSGVCDGATSFPLPIPLQPSLAGVVASSQCAVLCADPSGVGTSLSNCTTFVLQGN